MANLSINGITNSKLYYGIVSKVYEDDTADVLTYSYIRLYEHNKRYWAGDIVNYNNGYYYVNNSHVASDTSFNDNPQFFTAFEPLTFNKNISNPIKEIKYILPKCKIFINSNSNDTVTDNKINGSYRWLCVGTPVIVMKKIDEFIIVHFGKIDQALIDAGFVENSFYMFDYPDEESLFFITNYGTTQSYLLVNVNNGVLTIKQNLQEFYSNFDTNIKKNMINNADAYNARSSLINRNLYIDTPLGTLTNYTFSMVVQSIIYGDLNRDIFGKYLFYERGYYPYIDNGIRDKNEAILNTFYFFLQDIATSEIYLVVGIVYEDKKISFKYTSLFYNYPLLGSYFYGGFDSIKQTYYDFSSILPNFTSWNFIGDIGNSYNYHENSCDSVSLFFGLLTLYPEMNNGVLTLSYNYNETSGQWYGSGYNNSTANISISDNGETQSYLFKYDNTYTFGSKTLYEFHGVNKDQSGSDPLSGDYRRFRFGAGAVEVNADGTLPSTTWVNFIENYNHFPFSLRKCVYNVEVPIGGTNIFTINNIEQDIPTTGSLIWDTVIDNERININKVTTYNISGNTISIGDTLPNTGTSSYYVNLNLYFLYYLDKPISIPLYHIDDDGFYYTINKAKVFSHNVFYGNSIFSIITFLDLQDNLLEKMAFFYDGFTIYDIEDEVSSKIVSDYINITYSTYRNIGLVTNFIK